MITTQINGNLGRDSELKIVGDDFCILEFSVASSKKQKDGEYKTSWLSCKLFGNAAKAMERHFKKGTSLCLSGELVESRWEDKEGNKRSKHELLVNTFDFQRASKTDDEPQSEPKPSTKTDDDAFDDDIPF